MASFGNSPSSTQFWQLYAADATITNVWGNFYENTLDCNSSVKFSFDSFQILALRKDSSANSSALYINGSNAVSRTGANAQTLGSRYYLAGWNGKFMNGEIAEVMIYNVALGVNERQLVEGLLAWKYGLTASLPDAHPWKSQNPEVAAPPAIETRPATNITLSTAFLNGYLSLTGTAATAVSVAWGLTNGGEVGSGLWAATNNWVPGTWKEGDMVTYPAAGLASNRIYYFRYAASNSVGLYDSGSSSYFMSGAVDVQVPDAAGSEGVDSLTFSLSRPSTATNVSLSVPLVWGGDAQAGRDYYSPNFASNIVFVPGQAATNMVVWPVDDPAGEFAETVMLQPVPGAFMGFPAATGVIAENGAHLPTTTLGYWRFEATPGTPVDSSGNGFHFSTMGGTDPIRKPLPDSGLGSAFPRTIRDSGQANGSALTGRGLVPPDPAFALTAFTVEAFVTINADTSSFRCVAARWQSPNFTWFFGLAPNSRRLMLRYYHSSSVDVYAPVSGFDLQTNKDYYVSLSVDGTKIGAGLKGALFRVKNLTDRGPLLSGYADLPTGAIGTNSVAPFEVRQYAGGNGYEGWLDELRFSSGILAESQLMVQSSRSGALILLR